MNNVNRKTLFIFNNLNTLANAVPQMVNTLNKHKYGIKIPLNVYDLLLLRYGILDVNGSILINQRCVTATIIILPPKLHPYFFLLQHWFIIHAQQKAYLRCHRHWLRHERRYGSQRALRTGTAHTCTRTGP